MKDKLILPDIAFNATGKCTLQYTDPDTGKVMFETSGKNHVFIKQLVGTRDFQSSALRADLLLCQGGFDPGDDIPVIPGEPIGFGRVANDGTGLYRGTYRSADSYYNKKSLGKVSNKYVYDFLQNQALGRVDWVGLTGALTNSSNYGAATASWSPPEEMDFPESTAYYKVCNCKTGDFYYVEASSSTLYLRYGNTFSDTSVRSVSLYAALGTWSSGSAKVFIDTVNDRVYVLAYYRQSSSGSYMSKAVLLTESLSGAETVTTITSGGSYIQNGSGGGGAYNGKLVWLYRASTTSYRAYSLDLSTMEITSTTPDLPAGKSYLNFDETTAYVYEKYVWKEPIPYSNNDLSDHTYGDNYFLTTTPFHNMETDAPDSMLPPGNYRDYRYYYRYRCGIAPQKAFAGQWVSFPYNGNTPSLHSAYTKYRVPEDTPDRPEGMGMTVTYELEIEW